MMRARGVAMLLGATMLAACGHRAAANDDTGWAFPMSPPAAEATPDATRPLSLPGSRARFTRAALAERFGIADWRPDTHPAMPPIVSQGHRPAVQACAFCHLPSGAGRPENAALAGLPRGYIVEQMLAWRRGERHSSRPHRAPTEKMARIAAAADDAEILAAAAYFSALPHRRTVRVVESASVPRTRTTGWLYSRSPGGGQEPIGARIIEMPDDWERFERRDPAMRYTAYVPPGSVTWGARLTSGAGGRQACAACHGTGWNGAGDVPPLAGRSPTYIVRQLTDFRSGARGGAAAAPMRLVASGMTNREMIALAAFLATRDGRAIR